MMKQTKVHLFFRVTKCQHLYKISDTILVLEKKKDFVGLSSKNYYA